MKINYLITGLLALSLSACTHHADVMTPHAAAPPAPVPEEYFARNGGSFVSYDGEDGKTVLELLKAHAKGVQTSTSQLGEIVELISGIGHRDGNVYYWVFYVNGEMSKVVSGKYVTKNGDKIEWKLVGPHKQ